MEMPKLLFLIFVSFFLFSGCGNSLESESSSKDQIVRINLDHSSASKLSEYFSTISYTLIENDKTIPLVEPYQTVVTKNSFFVQDYFNIYIHEFNRK